MKIPECVEHLSSRNPGNLIHRKHVELGIPSSKRVDDRLVLYRVQERNEGAPLLQVFDLGPGGRRADFEQDVRVSVEFFSRHQSGSGGFVMFIEELRSSSSVPLDEDL